MPPHEPTLTSLLRFLRRLGRGATPPARRSPARPPAVEALEDALYAAGLEVSLPAFDVAEGEAQEIHIQNMIDCDAVLIYYGAAGKHWVDFKVRDLQKAAGYRGARPVEVAAVYLAPPFDRRKERFQSLSVDVIRAGDRFRAETISPFVSRAKALARRN